MADPRSSSSGDSGGGQGDGNADGNGSGNANANANSSSDAASPAAAATTNAAAAAAAAIDSQAIATNRKQYLLSLVDKLSLDEIWMLQKRLAGLDLRSDVVARLPPELQILIADELGPSDLGCCLQVSHKWRSSLLHKSMLRPLAARCFPSLLEYADVVHVKQAWLPAAATEPGTGTGTGTDTGIDTSTDTDNNRLDALVAEMFTTTAKRFAVRAQGRFSYVFRHCKDPPVWLDQTAWTSTNNSNSSAPAAKPLLSWLNTERKAANRPRKTAPLVSPLYPPPDLLETSEVDMLASDDDQDEDTTETYIGPEYAYGRLAWQSIRGPYTSFMVDDLHTGRRQVLNVPNSTVRGQTHLLSAFGDRLLISIAGTNIVAWDFTTGETYSKTIPAQMDTVATLGRAVYIMSQGNIYVWKMGGAMREADMTGLDERFRQPDYDGRLPSYFLPDPLDSDQFCLGNYEVDGGTNGLRGELRANVHRFVNQRYCGTDSHSLPFINFAFPSRIIGANARRDARGLYSIATWRADQGTPGWINKRTTSTSTSTQAAAAAAADRIGSLSYNIYTRKFALSYFWLPRLSPTTGPDSFRTITTHIWNSQLITLVDRYRDAPGGQVRVAKPLLLAFEDETSEEARCMARKPFSAQPLYVSTALPRDKYHKDTPAATLDNAAIIKPETRQQMRFHELSRGTPAQWRQSDKDWAANGAILRFGLDVAAAHKGKERPPAHIRMYTLEGDDDFLVMHYDNEYTVWCFDEGVDPTGWDVFRGDGGS